MKLQDASWLERSLGALVGGVVRVTVEMKSVWQNQSDRP